MKQIPAQKFVSDCGRASFIVENEMPVGFIHDYLLQLKGHMVDIMIAAHKQEKEQAEAQKKSESAPE